MTISTVNTTSGPYSGNGVTSTFSYTFPIESKNDLLVFKTSSTGVQTLLAVDEDYTVAGVGSSSGSITLDTGALPTGEELLIRSNRSLTQETDFDSQGGFFPDVHEASFDKLTILLQQLKSRALLAPSGENRTETQNTTPVPQSGYALGWSGNQLSNISLPSVTQPDTSQHSVTDYSQMRVNLVAGTYDAGDLVTVTDEGVSGDGLVVVASGSEFSDNGGTVIVEGGGTSSAGDFVWIRRYTGDLNVAWFDAPTDGTDASTAIQAAIDEGGSVFIPDGNYTLGSSLRMSVRGTRLYGSSLEGAVLIPPDNGPAILVGRPVGGGSANVFVEIDHLEFSGNTLGGGIRVTDSTRKVYIHHNRMVGMDYGVKVNDSWTVYITENHINDNTRNITIYRTATIDVSPTTIYIFNNSIMNYTEDYGYSISVGESGQDDYSTGEQCSTLIVEGNVMDGTKNYIQGSTNTRWNKNHAEGGYDDTPHLTFDTSSSSFVFSAAQNYIWKFDVGIEVLGSNTRSVMIQNNYFRVIYKCGIKLDSYLFQGADLSQNYFSDAEVDVLTSVRTSTLEAAEGVSSVNGRKLTFGGNCLSNATDVPTSGRYKYGDIVDVISGSTPGVYKFFPGGESATALSYTNLGGSNFTASVNAVTNVVTPSDIFDVLTGDRITIPAAGAGGADLDCVVRTIDYVAETFTVSPNPSIDVTDASVSFTGASDSNWYELPAASSRSGLDVKGQGGGYSAAQFNNLRTENITNGGTFTIDMSNQSSAMIFVRDTTSSNNHVLAFATNGINTVTVSKLIDNGSGLDVTASGGDIVISNTTGSNKDFAFSIMTLACSPS